MRKIKIWQEQNHKLILNTMHKVLIIDDEKDICFLISEILKDENYNTFIALNSDEAISKFNEIKPDLVILDVWLSNSKLDGIEILKEFKSINSNIPIIIISGHGTVDLAVKSIKNGAYDFLEKPFNSDKLIILTKRAIESSSLLSENKNLKDTLIKTIPLIGNSELPTKGIVDIKVSFKFLFSFKRDELSIALLIRMINLSLLNGFSKKS